MEPEPLDGAALEVAPAAVQRALEGGGAQVVDVREPYEREAGHIAGTAHIALAQLSERAGSLDPGRPLVFVCRVGARSLMAAQAFRRAGYRASSMAGGMERWAAEERPIAPEGGVVAPH
jgi:rhodanese-related sulfurtransferase